MASAHQNQFRGDTVEAFGQPGQVVEQVLRRQPDLAVRCPEHGRDLRDHRAEVDAVRLGLQLVEGDTVGVIAVPVTEGAGAQREVEDPLGAAGS